MAGRWKTDPNDPSGRSFDPNDTGPDQPAYDFGGGGGGGGSAPPSGGGYVPPPGATLKPGEAGTEANDFFFSSSTPSAPFIPPAMPGAMPASSLVAPVARKPLTSQTDPAGAAPSGSGSVYAPLGFDQTKWADQGYTSPKYVVGHIIQQGGSVADAAAAVGGVQTGQDTIRLPDGSEWDVVRDFEGAHQPQWGAVGAGSQVKAGAGAGASSGSTATRAAAPLSFGYAPPGGPGVYPAGLLQQIGQDPLSQLLDAGIAGLINSGGATPTQNDVMGRLLSIIDTGGRLPNQDQIDQRRFESAREMSNAAQTASVNDARTALASRGVASEPGTTSGAETSAIQRISERIAPSFAAAVRDIGTSSLQGDNERVSTALAQATGLSQDEATNFIQTLGVGTARQQMLADIALKQLDQNMQWNEFLAEFGLKRDSTLYMLQNGQVDQLTTLLSLFQSLTGAAANGFIG